MVIVRGTTGVRGRQLPQCECEHHSINSRWIGGRLTEGRCAKIESVVSGHPEVLMEQTEETFPPGAGRTTSIYHLGMTVPWAERGT